MPYTMYEASIPVFIRNMKILSKFLEKGRVHFAANESALLSAKLIDDMGGLPFQIQRVSDTVKGVAVRVGGASPAPIADDETTFPQLQERIKKAIAIAESIKEADMNANEEKEVILPSKLLGDIKMTGKEFIVNYAIPNFYFHVMAAYAILRKEGVDVGKNDFLGRGVDLD